MPLTSVSIHGIRKRHSRKRFCFRYNENPLSHFNNIPIKIWASCIGYLYVYRIRHQAFSCLLVGIFSYWKWHPAFLRMLFEKHTLYDYPPVDHKCNRLYPADLLRYGSHNSDTLHLLRLWGLAIHSHFRYIFIYFYSIYLYMNIQK